MSGIGSPKPARNAPGARRPRPAGAWAGYLIFGLCLLVFVVFDAQAAYAHQWSRLAVMIVITVAFVIFPTGGAAWLRRAVSRRRAAAGRDRPPAVRDHPEQ